MIRLLSDNVLVEIIAPEKMTASKLLWIPDSAKRADHELYHGRVKAVGPGRRGSVTRGEFPNKTTYATDRVMKPDVKVGDEVVWYWGGGEVAFRRNRYPDENHVILDEEQIQCVIEP